jgi:hypothetical protein
MFYVWQLTDAKDILYEFTDIAIWSTVENGLGLTASSLATLRPLIRKLRSKYGRTDDDADPSHNGTVLLTRPVARATSPSSDLPQYIVKDHGSRDIPERSDQSGWSSIDE